MRFYIQNILHLKYILLLFYSYTLYIPIINKKYELLSRNICTIDKNKYNYMREWERRRSWEKKSKNIRTRNKILFQFFLIAK